MPAYYELAFVGRNLFFRWRYGGGTLYPPFHTIGPMARNGKSKPKNLEPAAMTLSLTSSAVSPGPTTTNYLDLSQVCSLVNRRFYRQGLNWAIGGIKLITTAGYVGNITVSKLPNTWVMANAWEKSMRAWLRMNNEALEELPSIRPRFLDFKVYADTGHHQAGYVGNLMPTSLSTPPSLVPTFIPGEWESSKVAIPVAAGAVEGAVNEREYLAVGANYPGVSPVTGLDAVSMIEGYANSRGLPNVLDPNVPDDAADIDNNTPENWIAAIFNEGTAQTDEIVDVLINQNNIAPYPFENDGVNLDTMYPGGETQGSGLEFHDVTNVTATTIGGITRIKGGNFPCGLLRFDFSNTGTPGSIVAIQIDMIPGLHRGYLAESMTEM